MKKITIILATLLAFLSFVGCKVETPKDKLSEVTIIYFCGENKKGDSASISVGKRENIYVVDGIHTPTCEFSLISLNVKEKGLEKIEANIVIGEQKEQVTLELNVLSGSYMADLGRAIEGEERVKIEYQNGIIMLDNISKTFKVDYKKALEISLAQLGEDINEYYEGKMFQGESYLKVLDGDRFGGEGLYWCFSIVGENKSSRNVLIEVNDAENIIIG